MTPFKRLLKLASRNMFRNKRRALLTLMILILGGSGLMITGGFFQNIEIGFREAYIHSITGHLMINKKDFFKKGVSEPGKYLMEESERAKDLIELHPHVLYTVPRLALSGTINARGSSIPVVAIGVDPAAETRMSNQYILDNTQASSVKIVKGHDLDAEDTQGAILGQGLLKALKLDIGDSVFFMTAREGGSIDGREFIIRGAFETVMKDVDDRTMKIPLSAAQALWGAEGQVHSLLAILDDTKYTSQVQTDLAANFQKAGLPLEVIPWSDQALYYRQSVELMDTIYGTVQIILIVVLFFSIANTLNMALFERMHEFGTMMAMGNSRLTIFMVIFLEAALLGILGATLSLGCGAILAKIISAVGIEMPPPPQGTSSYYAMITLTPRLLLEAFGVTFLATLLSSIIPGYRGAHIRITRALGYV